MLRLVVYRLINRPALPRRRNGSKEPTWPELERLIDLIIHEQGKIIAHKRDLLAEARERRNK